MAQEPAPTGVILSLSGTVILHPFDAPDEQHAIRLSPRFDRGRVLRDGDQLQALQDGEVKFVPLISGKELTLLAKECTLHAKECTLHAKDGPVRLHSFQPITPEEEALNNKIMHFGNPGASREVAPLLWSPAADSSIQAQDFHLRWNPPHAAEPFSVTISRADDTRLWSVEAVDSAQGGLSPQQEAEVAGILLRERSQSALQRYSVMISSDLQGAQKTSFSVVSSAEEAQMQAGLARWEQPGLDPLLRAIARAETWRAANLIYKVAEEYDRALILAPDSVALLQADLAVHRQIGDLARSQELANRLRNLSSE
jgi:hypothetical protein